MIGAGKSNAGAVFGEEFYAAGLPFVAIDPKGDWWGLRSSGDGTGPGLPIPIFGGLHGDLPLHEDMGKLIADLIVDQNLTCILDVSEFASKAAQMRFLTDFGEHLYRRHGREPQPRHLIMEEADEYLPQMVRADEAKCVGVWTRIAKRGRQRGLGFTIISQRSAAVNKDALSQCAHPDPAAHQRRARPQGDPRLDQLPRRLARRRRLAARPGATARRTRSRRTGWPATGSPRSSGSGSGSGGRSTAAQHRRSARRAVSRRSPISTWARSSSGWPT